MAQVQCPVCNTIYKTPNEGGPYYCNNCNWNGKWKQEVAPEDEVTKEIEHLSLRGCH
jgi:hypothetical protein